MDPIFQMQLRNRLRHGKRIRLLKPKKWLFPRAAEADYHAKLNNIVDTVAAGYRSLILPALPALVTNAASRRADAWSDDLASLTSSLRLRIDRTLPDEEGLAMNQAIKVSDWNRKEWHAIVKKSIGVDLFMAEPWLRDDLRSWSQENGNLIGSLEDDAIGQVAQWTNRGIRQGWRWEDIASNIEARFDVTRNKARFIARDQTAKLNGDLTRSRQTQAGVKGYTWQTSMDERVRGNPGGLYPKAIPSHWARQGQSFLWSDAPEGGHPGHDYNCRCTAAPDLNGVLEAFS